MIDEGTLNHGHFYAFLSRKHHADTSPLIWTASVPASNLFKIAVSFDNTYFSNLLSQLTTLIVTFADA